MKIHQILIPLFLGLAIGYGIGQWQGREFQGFSGKQGDMKKRMMDRLDRELKLSEEQKQQVHAIFEAKHPKMMALHEEMRPKFEALKSETHEQIRKVLTPDQQTKFEALKVKMEERWKKKREMYQSK